MIKEIKKIFLNFLPVLIFSIFLNIYYDGNTFKLSNIQSVIAVFAISLIILDKASFKINKNAFAVYLFITVCFISCFLSDDFLSSVKRFFIVFLPFLMIFQTYLNIKRVEDVKESFEKYFIYFVIFLVIYALTIFLFDYFSIYGIRSHEISKSDFYKLGQIYYTRKDLFGLSNASFIQQIDIYRPSSLLSNTIGFSHLVLLAIYMNYFNENSSRFKKLILYFLFIITLFWTFSRISILIFMLVPFLIFLAKNKRYFIIFLIVKVFLFFLLIILQIENQSENFVFLDIINLGKFIDRFEIYKLTLLSFEDYFFNGVGFGQGSENFIMKKYSSLPSFYENQNLAIPSVPLTILVETGFLGLLFYIFLIPLVIKNNKNFYKKSVLSIFMILIIIQLTQYFDISLFRFHPLTFIFAIYLGIGCNKNLKFNA